MTNHRDLVWEKGMERLEIGQILRGKSSGKLATPVESILDLAKERNQSRSDGYGDRESFPAIRILWKAYLLARFGVDLDLTDADTADMLLLFKEGRKITRRNAGQYKKDDNVDQAGYVDWASRLEEMGNG